MPWLSQVILPLCGAAFLLFTSDLYDAAWRCIDYASGHVTTDLASLGVATLREILDEKGVDYSDVFEKSDLVRMVKEMDDACTDHLVFKTDAAPDINFRNGLEFDRRAMEQVTEIWLMLVVDKSLSELPGVLDTWSVVRKHVTSLGVQTGRLDCREDHKYCETMGVLGTRVFMVLPYEDKEKTVKAKKKVLRKHIHRYKGQFQHMPILQWFRKSLQISVINIPDVLKVGSEWMTFTGKSGPDFRAVFFTDQDTVPASISMLGLQYNGIVKVGVMRESNGLLLKWMKHHNIGERFPQLLILSREGARYSYGRVAGECFSFSALQWFFVMFTPYRSDHARDCFLTCFAVLVMWAVKTKRWGGLVVYTILCTAVMIFWWGHAIRGKSLALSALSSSQITSDSALHRGLLLYTQYPSLLVLCLLLLCFGLDQLARVFALDQLASHTCRGLFDTNCVDNPNPNANRGADSDHHGNVVMTDSSSEVDEEIAVSGSNTYLQNVRDLSQAASTTPSDSRESVLAEEGTSTQATPTHSVQRNQIPLNEIQWAVQLLADSQASGSVQGDQAAFMEMTGGGPSENALRLHFQLLAQMLRAESEDLVISRPAPDYINRLPTWEHPTAEIPAETAAENRTGDSENGPDSVKADPPDNAKVGSSASEESSAARNEETAQCVICLEEFKTGDKLCGLPCQHAFHYSCIETWLTRRTHSCPVCRAPSFTP